MLQYSASSSNLHSLSLLDVVDAVSFDGWKTICCSCGTPGLSSNKTMAAIWRSTNRVVKQLHSVIENQLVPSLWLLQLSSVSTTEELALCVRTFFISLSKTLDVFLPVCCLRSISWKANWMIIVFLSLTLTSKHGCALVKHRKKALVRQDSPSISSPGIWRRLSH